LVFFVFIFIGFGGGGGDANYQHNAFSIYAKIVEILKTENPDTYVIHQVKLKSKLPI